MHSAMHNGIGPLRPLLNTATLFDFLGNELPPPHILIQEIYGQKFPQIQQFQAN